MTERKLSQEPRRLLGVRVVSFYVSDPSAPFTIFALTCDYWLAAVTFAVLPTYWAGRRRRLRWTDPRVCRTCGDNLTAKTSGVCPECGIAPSKLGRGG